MLKVDDYRRIRRAHRDGMSIREIARVLHHSRHKIRKVLQNATPEPYTLQAPRLKRKLTEPFQYLIDAILQEDDGAPRKQRHTAKRIFDRLQAEHDYTGGYDTVRRYVNALKGNHRETFMPLAHEAGQRAESDFGHIYVDFPDVRRLVPVLLITWAYSNATFAIALASEKIEAIMHGTTLAFEFFGCVPQELWWDNPKTVAKAILRGRERKLNDHYLALASHFNFEPLFCLPARGNEKPHVEGRVKWLQRNWATPVPKMNDLDELNAHLLDCCQQDQQRTVSGKQGTIAERLSAEKQHALTLPPRAFDACVSETREVDKYQTVAWQNSRYSVPKRDAFSTVLVKAYVDRIDIVRQGQVIARHARSYADGEMLLDPLHYLTILGRKPAYLDHTDVYRRWQLPREFSELRDDFEQRHGRLPGARQFIQVLQLLGEHPLQRVGQAIKTCCREGVVTAQRIIHRCGLLAERAATTNSPNTSAALIDSATDVESFEDFSQVTVPHVHVPRPDLSRFDELLSSRSANEPTNDGEDTPRPFVFERSFVFQTHELQGGDSHDQAQSRPFAQPATAASEPQAAPLADDVGRARQVGSGSRQRESGLRGLPAPTDRTGVGHASFQCFAIADSPGWFSGPEGS